MTDPAKPGNGGDSTVVSRGGKTNSAHLTNAQLHSLAKRHLSGNMSTDLVGFAGLDLAQIRNVLASQRMKKIIEEEQSHLDTGAIRMRNNMYYGIHDSIARMKARGAGIDGPQIAYQADKFMIESLLPKKEFHIVEENVHHTFDANIAVKIRDTLDTAISVMHRSDGTSRPPLSTYTLLGTEGLARTEPEATQELVVEDVGPETSLPSKPPGPEEGAEGGEPDSTPDR